MVGKCFRKISMEEIHIKEEFSDSGPDDEEQIQTTLSAQTEVPNEIEAEVPENEYNYVIKVEVLEAEQNNEIKVEFPEHEQDYEMNAEIPESPVNEQYDNNIKTEVSEDEQDDGNNYFIERPRIEARLRTSCNQFLMLLEFMERHRNLSHPQEGFRGRLRADQLWQELTDTLNSVKGGVPRTIEKWKRVWTDWKAKTKKKASMIRKEASATGKAPSIRQILTVLEERVLKFATQPPVIGQCAVEQQSSDLQPSRAAALEIHSPSAASETGQSAQPDTDGLPHLPNIVDPSQPRPSHSVQEVVGEMTPSPPPPRLSPTPQSGSTPRRRSRRSRRNMTPFERVSKLFVTNEEQRWRFEENRDRMLHERELKRERMLHEIEMERLREESRRLEAKRRENEILLRLTDIPRMVADMLFQFRSSIDDS